MFETQEDRRFVVILACALASTAAAQTPARIDYLRDVQPIFRQNCYGCHGATQQTSGLRLDRRSSVFNMRRVSAGSVENSFLYARVSAKGAGQMPPGGSLSPDQIRILKGWIEQGAEWPDSAANEQDVAPADPVAASLVRLLADGRVQAFLSAVSANPKHLNARGPEGATPFLYAVRYLDAATLRKLLAKGANPNLPNDAGATALMWSGGDLDKTKALLESGADVNAISDNRRTALMIASGRSDAEATVRLLLDRGANPNPTTNPVGDSSPLVLAASAGAAESMRLLLDRGADLKGGFGILALSMALASGCRECAAMLMSRDLGVTAFDFGLINSVSSADTATVSALLDRGAQVNFTDNFGRTPLMYAAISGRIPVDVVRLLIDRGADVNAISKHEDSVDAGMSVLDIALLNGETPVVELLRKSGAKSVRPMLQTPEPRGAPSISAALERSLPRIQRADEGFSAKAGCISCHHNNLAALVVSRARALRVRVDEQVAARQLKANAGYLRQVRESLQQGFFPAQAGAQAFGNIFGPSVVGYMLIALAAEAYPRDLETDAAVMYLTYGQRADGHWEYPAADSRAPLGDDEVAQTVLSMRALQLYAPKQPVYEAAIRRASVWLAEVAPARTYGKVWKLMGLAWAQRAPAATRKSLREVAALQRSDGGWSDLPTTESNAFETGLALTVMNTAGMTVSNPVYARGVRFLIESQQADGTWFVRSRALGSQPYFETGFPHGYNQSISAAGTSWASLALALAAPGSGRSAAAFRAAK